MSRPPDRLEDLPPNCVRPLGSLPVATLGAWARDAGQRFVLVDLGTAVNRKSVLRAIGRAFAFPDWYGANLDALYDCLTDLPERGDAGGWLVVLAPMPRPSALDAEQREALLDVFRDAAGVFAKEGLPLRVLYAAD